MRYYLAAQEAERAAHQASSEPVHGVVADRAAEADLAAARPPPRRHLQVPGQEVAPALHTGQTHNQVLLYKENMFCCSCKVLQDKVI